MNFSRKHFRAFMLSITLLILCQFALLMRKMNHVNNYFYGLAFEMNSTPSCSVQGDKWIVITTIAYPTQAIEKFLSIEEWNLMIIGDKKTPKDWLVSLPESVRGRIIFLSIDDQLKLEYEIIRYIPQKSYARKNIGYLVAIKCGAKIIYESDDDNLLLENNIRMLPKYSNSKHIPWVSFHRERSPFVNIYGSFGHPKIWPRGFPIDELRNVTEDGWSSLRQTSKNDNINAYVQQYLADLDPDVDALYRLTHPMTIGRIQFDRNQQPVALEPYTFSPYNTQNTVTHYEAFWGLYLPVTTTFRVCDIWRGFWVQRLLWDIGGQLVFGTATVQQIRNAHNYIKDMDDEQQMYHQSGKFVRFLSAWNSSLPTLFQRIRQLAVDIAYNEYWSVREVDMINAWLNDLSRVGYSEPSIVSHRKKNLKQKKVHAALCVTGLMECTDQGRNISDPEIKKHLEDGIDIFVFLSSTQNSKKKIEHARRIPVAVQVFYEDRKIDSTSPLNCTSNFALPHEFKVNDYLQQTWSMAKCYELVQDYEQKMNIKYQLLIRARSDNFFMKENRISSSPLPSVNENSTNVIHDNYLVFGDFNEPFSSTNKFASCKVASNLNIVKRRHEFCFRHRPSL